MGRTNRHRPRARSWMPYALCFIARGLKSFGFGKKSVGPARGPSWYGNSLPTSLSLFYSHLSSEEYQDCLSQSLRRSQYSCLSPDRIESAENINFVNPSNPSLIATIKKHTPTNNPFLLVLATYSHTSYNLLHLLCLRLPSRPCLSNHHLSVEQFPLKAASLSFLTQNKDSTSTADVKRLHLVAHYPGYLPSFPDIEFPPPSRYIHHFSSQLSIGPPLLAPRPYPALHPPPPPPPPPPRYHSPYPGT
jgi:hypothetical protein